MPSVIPHGYKMVRADPTKMVNPVDHAKMMFERNAKIEMANNLKKGSMEMQKVMNKIPYLKEVVMGGELAKLAF